MYSSASSSSSAVVTPARACSPSRAIVSATMRPARAIRSSSSGDLRMITSGGHLVERNPDLREDVVDRTVRVDADDVPPGRTVVLDERSGLALVDLEPLADRVRRVVGASLVGRALRQTLEQHLAVTDLELEDYVEVAAQPREERVERLGLRGVARKAVEDEAGDRVAAVEARLDQLDDGLVVDQVAPVVDLANPASELGVELLDLPDHVAGRDLRDPVGPRDELRLGSFAGPLWPEKKDVHPLPPAGPTTEGSPRTNASSSAIPS